MDSAVIDVLFAPLRDRSLRLPEQCRSLFLHAQVSPHLHLLGSELICQQDFKPDVDALSAAGCRLDAADAAQQFDLVLLLPSRQRDQTRAAMVDAARHANSGGTILMAAANQTGARSLQDDAAHLFGVVSAESMSKCRVIWSLAEDRRINALLAQQWLAAAAPRLVPQTAMQSAPGMFSWNHVDPGSALLAAHLPDDLIGDGADLGAGWGFLAAEVLRRCTGISTLHLYEADRRALAMAQSNLDAAELSASRAAPMLKFFWHDVTQGLPHRYDFIVSNPPFHTGRADDPQLGRAFIRAAAVALRPGGRLFLVANRHLPYELPLREQFAEIHKHADSGGFKVLEARKGMP